MKLDFKNYDAGTTKDFNIPETGIEDIDRAVLGLFDSDISFNLMSNNELIKVPVVFAAGERFALTRRKDPIRDENNTLILPIISIVRGAIDFSNSQSGRGSAIATRDQSNYVIKKRLSSEDRDYQNIINKFGIKNQDNVSSRNKFIDDSISPGKGTLPNTIATRRQTNALKFSKIASIDLGSQNSLGNNIFEIIQVPYPIFVTITYSVTFWAQYMTQLNEIQEIFLSSMLGQSEEFVIVTDKGYEFVAKTSTSFTSDSNFSNYTDSERIIKSNVDITVAGYILNKTNPGIPNQIRSFFSAPTIEFGYIDTPSQIVKEKNAKKDVDKFILSDLKSNEPVSGDSARVQQTIINPFTGDKKVVLSQILSSDQRSGETVVSNLIVKEIDKQYE